MRTLQFKNDPLDPEQSRILSGSYDGKLYLWDFKTGEILVRMNTLLHQGTAKVFKAQMDSTKIIAGLQDGQIIIYDFAKDVENPNMFI